MICIFYVVPTSGADVFITSGCTYCSSLCRYNIRICHCDVVQTSGADAGITSGSVTVIFLRRDFHLSPKQKRLIPLIL